MAEVDVLRRAARSRYWREVEARAVVDAWRASGESLAVFCRRHGVATARVARWSARLEGVAPVQFHPVRLRADEGNPSRSGFEVELRDGTTVRVPPGFESDDLRRILAAVALAAGC